MPEQALATVSESGASRSVADLIEEEIVLGWLHPRERLVEEELALRYSVKRHLVRDALLKLERIGLVERTPNKGAVVRMLGATEVEQIYAVREVLEVLAAEQISLPASPALIDALSRIQERHSAALEANDSRAAFHANLDFHHVLFGACGNACLAEMIRSLEQKVHGVRSYTAGDPVHLRQARDEHIAMIESLRTGDRLKLIALCRAHLIPARAAYIAGLRRRGLA